METQSDINCRRDSNADQNRSEHQKTQNLKNSTKGNKTSNNNHFNCNKSSKSIKCSDGQSFNTSKDKHQNKNKTQTQRERDCIKPKKSSNLVKNNNSFNNDLKISSANNKCNNNKKNKDKDKEISSSTSNHKIKHKDKDNHSKTSRDVIGSNKSLNDLLDNNRSLSNRETSLASNQKNSSLVVKEFKFFKEKAKDKLKKSITASTSKSSKTSNGSNSCAHSCKQVVKSGDVLSTSAVSDSCAKHKSKPNNGPKESKQWRHSLTSPSGECLTTSATSSANNSSCDPKTLKVKTSAKTNKQLNTKYNNSSDNKSDINCSETKKSYNSTSNKTISQSSKSSKTKTSIVDKKEKSSKSEGKRKNKAKIISPLYDEDIIDGFAILSFKTLDDIEITINGKCSQKKDKQPKDETSISSTVSSTSSSSLSSQLKCNNKSNESKSSKLSANKHSKSLTKDIKSCKIETKNSVNCVDSKDSKLTKCSKKGKQNENNGNNKNNNKNVDNNKDQQKSNNRLNSSKSQSLDSLSSILTVNKKTSIKAHKPEVSNNNNIKRESTQDNIHEQNTSTSAEELDDSTGISLAATTSPSNTKHQKTPSVGINPSISSTISDCDKTLISSSKRQSSASNDSSLSSTTSSSTLPLIGSDGESVGQLSVDHNIGSDLNNDCESESTTCSSSKAPTNQSNRVLTPPPLPALTTPPLTNSSVITIPVHSPSLQLCTSEVNKPLTEVLESSEPLDPLVIETKDKVLNGSERTERTFPSHFIESVLRNTSPTEQCNARSSDDRPVVHTNHSLHSLSSSPPLINKLENNNKENSNILVKVCPKTPKTTSSSANVLNGVKTGVKDSLGLKRTASPLPSNQSTAAKHIRHSSPNNQIKNFDSINSGSHSTGQTPSNRSTSSSLSSLSQLSQSIGQSFSTSKERDRDREEVSSVGANSNKSATSRSTPSVTVSNPSPENTFPANYSSKSHLWSASSSSTGLNGSSVPHLSPNLTPRPTTPNIGLTSSLHTNSLGMFASPIPPVSLPSVGGAVAPSATPSPFIGDSLFSHQNQDFLRRELDTRFLASQDRTINIPPPPYMRSEMHQHIHLPQTQPFPMAQTMGSPLVPPTNPHLYEKYPKLDQNFYGRNALTLPGFPSLSPLLTPGGSSSTTPQSGGLTASLSTPFGAPAHLAAFQPKLNSLSAKPKPLAKSGRWCAMHVRIAWEIYHHQQKQQMDITHKSGVSSAPNSQSKSGSSADLLRPLNHLFSLGRTQDLPPFSSALMNAASSRAPFDSPLPSHHNPFVSTPVSSHLSSQTTSFPRFPTFGSFGSLGSPLSLPPVAGPPTPSGAMFGPTAMSGGRDLPIPGCLPGLSASGPDMWSRNASTRPTSALFPPLTASTSSASSSSSSSWGGLKAEAERNRLNEDMYHKRKHSDNGDKEAKRFERENKFKSDDKHESKHKDQNHSQTHGQTHSQTHSQTHNQSHSQTHKHNSNTSSSHVRNGDIYSDYKKDWIKSSKRDTSRSPVHHSHHSSHSHPHHSHHHSHSHIHSHSSAKTTTVPDMSAFDNNNRLSSVGVKDEQKNENNSNDRERQHRYISDANEAKVRTSVVPTIVTSSASNLMNSSTNLAMNPLEKARLMGLFGLHGTPPPVSPHYSANNPNDPLRSYWNPMLPAVDPFKSLHELQVRPDFLERDNIFQRYSLLNSSGGGAPIMDRIAKESVEKEMLNHSIEKHNSKLIASHLRSNESFTSGLSVGHNPHTPHTPHMSPSQTSMSSNHFPANPYLNSLHSLSASAGSYLKNKSSTAVQSSSSSSSSEPSSPSLAPTNGILPALIPNVLNHSNLTNSKLSIGSLIESPLESIKDMNNKKSETNSTSMTSLMSSNGNTSDVEILETNSR